MTKQEKIRLWLSGFLAIGNEGEVCSGAFEEADTLLRYLHDNDVVIKVANVTQSINGFYRPDTVVVESLIEEA